MAGGLAALLDDVAMIAKMASAAGSKAVGVVVDDTAVTPRYVHGFSPARELPMIGKIALGSVRNKLVFILPAILLMSQFVPWLLTPLLMVGGAYLCYEGAEKLWELVTGHREGPTPDAPAPEAPAVVLGADYERQMVSGAIRTDFILSAEIMVISLTQVAEADLLQRAIALVIVALAITALVYGVVAVIVKMDDVGLHLAQNGNPALRAFGSGLVRAMPKVLSLLSTVGIVAMLWVGGHILLTGVDKLGWHAPYGLVHQLETPAEHVHPFLGWLVDTGLSAVAGILVGAVLVAILHVLPLPKKSHAGAGH
nr:DUF808 domain-containing protein [Propionibacterium sp.]